MNHPRDPRKDGPTLELFHELEEAIAEHHSALVNHPVYGMIQDKQALCTFMTSHVFAVWDFMTLLKSLQRSLTCVTTPWVPPEQINCARLVNEIVLGEETDEIFPGVYISHFNLYRAAMDEMGADRAPIDAFIEAVIRGADPAEQLTAVDLPEGTRAFVVATLELAERRPHEVAAAFLYGRENVIPAMFIKLLANHTETPEEDISRMRLKMRSWAIKLGKAIERRYSPREVQLPEGPGPDAFRTYLERHIELDGESHGPMGERLIMELCGRDVKRWAEATAAAIDALEARRAMWDSVMQQIQGERAQRLEDGRSAGFFEHNPGRARAS